MTKKRGSRIATVLLAACAVVLTALVARRELVPTTSVVRTSAVDLPDSVVIEEGRHVMGSGQAQTVIVEFADFQCSFCAVAAAQLRDLVDQGSGAIAVTYRHYPSARRPFARPAAIAAECAGQQGRFYEYHDALFANQDSIGAWAWQDFARLADVRDVDAFDTCVDDMPTAGVVDRDADVAQRLGIRGTPAFVHAGRLYTGIGGLEVLRAELEKAGARR